MAAAELRDELYDLDGAEPVEVESARPEKL